MTTSITVAQALGYEQDPSQIPPNTVFDIIDTAANIETLTASDISSLSSLLSVSSMTATDAPVTYAPGGPEQAALKSTGITITAYVSASEAIALDVQHNISGTPLLVPPDESVIVLDTAANLEALTPNQLSDLGTAVDTANAHGNNTGNSAITQIAATDAPAVYTPNQVVALSGAGITVVAPPGDPGQNDGTTVIAGRGTTFDITWDSSVASAPPEFKTDVEEVFQMFADTYSSPATLYYHVGYGEVDGNAVGPGFLGRSFYSNAPKESYSTLVSHLTADATSPVQLAALSTLPATNPTGEKIFLSQAQAALPMPGPALPTPPTVLSAFPPTPPGITAPTPIRRQSRASGISSPPSSTSLPKFWVGVRSSTPTNIRSWISTASAARIAAR